MPHLVKKISNKAESYVDKSPLAPLFQRGELPSSSLNLKEKGGFIKCTT